MRLFPKVPDQVYAWWDATKQAANIRHVLMQLKRQGLSVPPDIIIDWHNAVARVQALKDHGADAAAAKWCKTSGFAALDPFLGAGAVQVVQERKGRDRAFHVVPRGGSDHDDR